MTFDFRTSTVIQASSGSVTLKDITLPPLTTITATIHDPEGDPVAGVAAYVTNLNHNNVSKTFSTADGGFSLTLPHDTYHLQLFPPSTSSLAPGYYSTLTPTRLTAGHSPLARFEPSDFPIDLTIILTNASFVSVTTKDANGNLISGISLGLCHSNGGLCQSGNSASPRQELAGGDGSYRLHAVVESTIYYLSRNNGAPTQHFGEALVINFPADSGKHLEFRIPDPDDLEYYTVNITAPPSSLAGWSYEAQYSDRGASIGISQLGNRQTLPLPDSAFRVLLQSPAGHYYYDAGQGNWSLDRRDAVTHHPGDLAGAGLTLTLPTALDVFDPIEVELELVPGVNIIPWTAGTIPLDRIRNAVGGSTMLARLAGSAPEPGSIALRLTDADRDGHLGVGDVLVALHFGSDATTIKTYPPPPFNSIELAPDGQIVAWPGPSDTRLADIAKGLGSLLREIAVIPRVEGSRPQALGLADDPVVDHGALLFIDVSAPTVWLGQQSRANVALSRIAVDHAPSTERFILRELADVQALFWSHYGLRRDDLVLTIVPWRHHSSGGLTGITLDTFAIAHSNGLFGLLVHEYWHTIQWAHDPERRAPSWMIEGSAQWLQYSGPVRRQGSVDWGEHYRRYAVEQAGSTEYSLKSLAEETDNGCADELCYDLGYLAVELLMRNHGGEAKLIDYWRQLQVFDEWQEAFAEVFGTSVEEFYEQYAEWRAAGFPRPVE